MDEFDVHLDVVVSVKAKSRQDAERAVRGVWQAGAARDALSEAGLDVIRADVKAEE